MFAVRAAALHLAAPLLCICVSAGAYATNPAPLPLFSPYQDVALDPTQDAKAPTGIDASGPTLRALPQPSAITLAFVTGDCAAARIGGVDLDRFARAHQVAWARLPGGYLIATGGETGTFTCNDPDAMERFLANFSAPGFLGIDLDIEGASTPAATEALLRQVAGAQLRHPHLRVSLTLATAAAASGVGLNSLGLRVLAAARAGGLRDFRVNLMVMDYGPPDVSACIVADGFCDMARSAEQAVENLHRAQGLPYDRIEVTPMIGINDSPGNIVSLADAERIARFARERGLAGLHYWSLDRDRPCASATAQERCSGLAGPAAGAFYQAFARGLTAGGGAR